jgi:hypothetical protein
VTWVGRLIMVVGVLAVAVGLVDVLTSDTDQVLLVGDSIMRQTGPALTRQIGDEYTVHNEGVNGSGLLTPAVFDWDDQLEESLLRTDPDIVVMLFIGNYTDEPDELWTTPDGEVVDSVHDPEFAHEWGVQVDEAMAAIEEAGARVVLVLPPPMATGELQAVVDALRAEYERVAADWDFVTLADATEAVGGENGEWVASLPDSNGSRRPVRVPDTVHLAVHGQRLVAREIADTIRDT